MRKLLLIAGAVCALALFTASAQASHGCPSGYGGGYGGGFRGYAPSYHSGFRGHGHIHSHRSFYAPRRSHSLYGHGQRHHHHHGGLHIGGRRFHIGFRF